MGLSSGKSRGAIPFDTSSDHSDLNSSKGNHSNLATDLTYGSYDVSELTPVSSTTTTTDLDVNKLTDDEVRERFKSVMVSISHYLRYLMVEYLRMIYSKEMKTKKKMSEQTSTAHMREILNSHYKLATVSKKYFFPICLKTNSI